jgi:hypothetical protein
LRYLSFGVFEEDFPRFRERLVRIGIKRLDPPPGYESNGLWFRDHDQNLIEIQVCEKTSPNENGEFSSLGLQLTDRGGPRLPDFITRAGASIPSTKSAWEPCRWPTSAGWGLLRHVPGSNFSHYVRDPWGGYFEYTCDIDYIPANFDWKAGYYKPEDSIYLWVPPLRRDFIVNSEAKPEVESAMR